MHRKPSVATARNLLPLFVLLFGMFAATTQAARAQGGGGASDAADSDEDDDEETLNTIKSGKRPSHFAIKTKERLGLRHAVTPDFSVEAFGRSEQYALDNPLSSRSSIVIGGLETAYKFGATTWMVTFETGEAFTRFFEHTNVTEYKLFTTLQRQIKLGNSALSIAPRVEAGYEWSSDLQQQRWKIQVKSPLLYQISDAVILMPLIPKLTYYPYTDRPDNRADLTMNISAGARWLITPSAFLQAEFGFENRWSNIRSVEYSRWLLTPEINLRVAF